MAHLKKISQSKKILFPNSGITKGQLIAYYKAIAVYMLPYLKDRPLTLHRFPDGITKKGFFQKNAPDYFPTWIKTKTIKKQGGWVNHVICNSEDSLAYLVGQGCITFHIALSKIDKLYYPDKMIFDLDPSSGSFTTVIKGGNILRSMLENQLNLTSYPMLTGSSGLHIMVPLDRSEHFDEVHRFAKNIAQYLADKHPEDFTVNMRKEQRKGRLFLDYLRNSYAQTAICPFSVRAFEDAPVAIPVSWDELQNGINSAKAFNIHNVFYQLKIRSDPWLGFDNKPYNLKYAKSILKEMS